MMTTSTAIAPRAPSTSSPLAPPALLADEHRALLRDVQRRTDAAVALLDEHVWPGAELDTLVRYLHAAVLRQASDEEVLLYPRGSAAPLAELSEDHVRLHELTGRLEQAEVQSCSLPELRARLALLLTVLERHLRSEQAMLASLPDIFSAPPSTASAAAATSSWLPFTGEPVCIDLGADPSDDAVQTCLERLLRLRPGERADVRSGEESALAQVCRWLHRFDAEGFGVERPRRSDGDTVLQVSRRRLA